MVKGNGNLTFRNVYAEELIPSFFSGFDRYQNVTKCLRRENGVWAVKDIAFVEQWDEADYEHLIDCLIHTLRTGGAVFAALEETGTETALRGFASVEGEFLESQTSPSLQLSSLHVSFGHRGNSIGEQLFILCAQYAREKGAWNLYISSHSAVETQHFYRDKMGCTDVEKPDPALFEAEPCDCHLEYAL